MSINYYAIPIRDAALVGEIVEGRDSSRPIDVPAIREAMRKCAVKGGDQGTMRWEDPNGDYVFVDVLSAHVLVTHNAGRGSYQLQVVMDVLDGLRRAGLHVYDPQKSSWFFEK